jgi:hypothetical protein
MGKTTLQSILEQMFATHNRMADLLDDFDAALSKEPTAGQNAKRLLEYFVRHWERRYRGQKMLVNGPKDMATFKRILRQLGVDEVAARIGRYFKGDDRQALNAKHSVGLFALRINELVPDVGDPSGPIGCTHTPPCTTDVQHTKRKLDEQKATP